MDKIADAYKAKKDADVKKLSTAALDTAVKYKKVIDAIPYECRIAAGQRLNTITKNLQDLKAKGAAATVHFK